MQIRYLLLTALITTQLYPAAVHLKQAPAPVKKPAAAKQAVAAKKTRKCTVCNTIDDKDLDYKVMIKKYRPTEFKLTVHDKPVNQGEKHSTEINDGKLEVSYYAKFQNGRESSKKYTFKLNPKTTKLDINFNWKKDPRIMIDGNDATLEDVKDLV